MKPLAKLTYLAAACALLVTTFAIVGPRTVHAVTAALIRDVDNAGRHPFIAGCGNNTTGSSTSCNIFVPAGEEVVIQTEALAVTGDPVNKTALATVQTVTNFSTMSAYDSIQDNGLLQPAVSSMAATFNHTLYADPSTNITCTGLTKNTNPTNALVLGCQVTGYYVTLP